MKPSSTWYANSQRIRILMMSVISGHVYYNLSKQLAARLWITSFDNQLATRLLTTCNRLVVNKVSQTMRTHPDIGLSIMFVAK